MADFYNRVIAHYEGAADASRSGSGARADLAGRVSRSRWPASLATPARLDERRSASPSWWKGLGPSYELDSSPEGREPVGGAWGQGGIEAARGALAAEGTLPRQRVHGLWVLWRLGVLNDATLEAAVRHEHRELRLHAQRILGEIAEWNSQQREWAMAGLKDDDPFVQRAAVEALGRHPLARSGSSGPLLDFRLRVVSRGRPLLVHGQPRLAAPGTSFSRRERGTNWATSKPISNAMIVIAEVAGGVPTPEAAEAPHSLLLKRIRSSVVAL